MGSAPGAAGAVVVAAGAVVGSTSAASSSPPQPATSTAPAARQKVRPASSRRGLVIGGHAVALGTRREGGQLGGADGALPEVLARQAARGQLAQPVGAPQ